MRESWVRAFALFQVWAIFHFLWNIWHIYVGHFCPGCIWLSCCFGCQRGSAKKANLPILGSLGCLLSGFVFCVFFSRRRGCGTLHGCSRYSSQEGKSKTSNCSKYGGGRVLLSIRKTILKKYNVLQDDTYKSEKVEPLKKESKNKQVQLTAKKLKKGWKKNKWQKLNKSNKRIDKSHLQNILWSEKTENKLS